MEEYIIRSTDTDPESAAVFRAAASVYASWCSEHDLKAVPVGTLRINPSEYTLYDRDGGPLIKGEIDALRPVLGL